MNTNPAMRRITEVSGDNFGYHVRFYSPTKDSQWFSGVTLGKQKALRAAKDWRDERERELGLTEKDYGARRPRQSHANSKGDTGVFTAIGTKAGRFYADVMAVLNFTDENGKAKRKQKTVSILKNGYHAAYVKALEERHKLTGLPLPEVVTVPKLSDTQIDQLMAAGATVKSLTEKVTVPWTGKLA